VTVLAVDLAAKYSAACLMDEDYQVINEFDSWGRSESQFIAELVDCFVWATPDPDVMVVEDLPHGLRYSTLIKTVCRLQGRIFDRMQFTRQCGDDILFLAPAEWRRTFPGMERGTGPEAVTPVSAAFGYKPPDLSERAKVKGGKAIARKVATDYCSGYLIARWAIDTKTKHGTYDVTGTSRYNTQVIRKKDFDAQNCG
jgi:hypothetical protein